MLGWEFGNLLRDMPIFIGYPFHFSSNHTPWNIFLSFIKSIYFTLRKWVRFHLSNEYTIDTYMKVNKQKQYVWKFINPMMDHTYAMTWRIVYLYSVRAKCLQNIKQLKSRSAMQLYFCYSGSYFKLKIYTYVKPLNKHQTNHQFTILIIFSGDDQLLCVYVVDSRVCFYVSFFLFLFMVIKIFLKLFRILESWKVKQHFVGDFWVIGK